MARFKRGERFAGHLIMGLLGVGEVAEVYEVFTPDERRRALKVLKEDAGLTSKLEARLAQEGEAIATIEHVNVVRFFDAGAEDGRGWLLIELVEGQDLRRSMSDAGGKLPVERAVRIVRQACEGVAAAHELGIVHRDLRPENILVSDDDVAKVADFGWAKPTGYGVKTSLEQEVSTPLCRAPELLAHGAAGPKSDVYSMGLVLYEALTGANPMAPGSTTLAAVCLRHMTFDPPPLDSLGLGIPGDLSDLARWALRKDPAHRCSMRELADGLARVLHRLNAHRRAVARSLPARNGDPRLAKTEPALPAVTRGGTIPMAAFPGTVAERQGPERAARDASSGSASASPPAPPASGGPTAVTAPPAPAFDPTTVRSPGAPAPATPPGSAPRRPAAVTVAMGEAAPFPERASTSVPVERPAPRASRAPRASSAAACVAGAGVLLVLGALGAGWLSVGRGSGVPARAAPSAPAVAVDAGRPPVEAPGDAGSDGGPAPASSTEAGAPRPKAPAMPVRRRATPPRPRLPFP